MANTQSSPNFVKGQVPTAAQWNSYFSGKQDALLLATISITGNTTVIGTARKYTCDTTLGDIIITVPVSLGQPGKENRVEFVKRSASPNSNKVYLTTDGTMATNFFILISENDAGGVGWVAVDMNGSQITGTMGLP